MGQKTDKNITRKPYVISEEEMSMLLDGILSFGYEETYGRIKARSERAMMSGDNDVDETLMDMHDTVLNKARYADTGDQLKSAMYCLTKILRSVAHDIRKLYRNKDQNHRFLYLASSNKDLRQF